MGTTKSKIKSKEYAEIKWILFSAFLITIFINPKFTDPFNAPKMHLLILCSIVLVTYLFFAGFFNFKEISRSAFTVLILIFLFILIAQVIFTDMFYTALFGESLRQLGVLTYFGFTLYMAATYKYFKHESKRFLNIWILTLGQFYVVYGILQFTGNDPFNWVNQYNPIIGTLGNPNYSAALMAILATLSFSFIFDKEISKFFRSVSVVNSILLFVVINLTNARQGLLSVSAGIFIYAVIRVYKLNKIIGITGILTFILGTGFVVAGILQSGPLEKFLYKPSVTLRGYYWNAGIEMFKGNVLTGVGIDRYGANFKKYIDPNFPLNYGYELMSNNAHNVPIQFFATGGLFLGTCYLLIMLSILFYAVIGFRKLNGAQFNLLAGIFAAWVSFQLQSFVSIDNIGLTIWGWILGGAIVALAKPHVYQNASVGIGKNLQHLQKKTISTLRPVVTGILLIIGMILVAKLTQAESIMFKNRTNMNQINNGAQSTLQEDLNFILMDPFAQPYYKIEAADAFYMLRMNDQAIKGAEHVVKLDPVNPIYMGTLATMYETMGQYTNAINLRVKLISFDPYNAKNYLQLLKLYKQVGDLENAIKMREKIITLAPNSETANLAKSEVL